jgi:poly(hydroxyalkanoate) granule-associated protein
MSKNLKALAGEDVDSGLAATIRDSAHNIWLAGLGAFVKAQQEGGKLFDSLVKEGEVVQQRAKMAADEKIADLQTTASGTWEKLEQVFEDRVARALRSIGVPTDKDVQSLSERVAQLTAVVEKLSVSRGDNAASATPKRPAKKS